jgi:bile acid-coenzyme A ligase
MNASSLIPMGDLPLFHSRRPESPVAALVHAGEALSWAELDRRANRRAAALRAAGVRADDFVTLALPNGAAVFELTFAVWKLGATPHVVAPCLPLPELQAILELVRPRLVIAADPSIQRLTDARGADFGSHEGSDAPIAARVARSWKAMSSGGSTGRPKVIVSHRPAEYDPATVEIGMPSASSVLNPGPLYHNAPFSCSHLALFRGSTVIDMGRFEAEEALRLIQEHRVAWVNFVPTMMHRIWRLPTTLRQQYDLSSLRAVWHMAAPMPKWLKAAWIEWLGPECIFELYGGTEGQGFTTIGGEEWLQHPGSVGRPLDCELRILGEDGRELPPGEVGEIYLRPLSGPTYHYLGAEARVASGGFESIGDFGWCDAEGYLYIADRRTDLIISGGANVYPAEVEGALMEHPAVDSAIVIGLPDEDLGARVHAIIRPARGAAPSLEELKTFLGERLSRYKIPRSLELTDQPLRDEAGKVRRSQWRSQRLAGTRATGARHPEAHER